MNEEAACGAARYTAYTNSAHSQKARRLFDPATKLVLASGLLACCGAVALLRSGWNGTRPGDPWRTVMGWAALAYALISLALHLGVLIGSTLALLAFSLSGFIAVALNVERRSYRTRQARVTLPDVTPQNRGKAWGRGLSASVLSMIAALMTGSASTGIPLGLAVNRVTIGGMVLPLIWASLIIWAVSDPIMRRPIFGMGGVITLSGICIAIELTA